MINYVDNALDYASSKRLREYFEISLKNKFNLTLLGIAKWYLGIKITQKPRYILLNKINMSRTSQQDLKNLQASFQVERLPFTIHICSIQERLSLNR